MQINDATTTNPFLDDSPIYSVTDFIRITMVSRATAFRHLDEIPHCRVGRFIRFTPKQIREYLAGIECKKAA